MGKRKRAKESFDFWFMFPDGNVFFETSPEEQFEIVENYGDSSTARVKYKPDIPKITWSNNQPATLTLLLKNDIDENSDPDDFGYVRIPFYDLYKDKIQRELRMEAGRLLLGESLACREYFRLWWHSQLAYRQKISSDSPLSSFGVYAFGASILFGIGLLWLLSSMLAGSLEAAIMGSMLFWVPAVLLMNERHQKILTEKTKQKVAQRQASETFQECENRRLEFLENNPWFKRDFMEALSVVEEYSDLYIAHQEEQLQKRRDATVDLDPYTSDWETEFEDSLYSAEDREEFLENRIVPEKMSSFTPYNFEIYCSGWVEYLGGQDVRVTQQSADGGVDVVSNGEVAQVKLHGSPVGVQPLREIFGVARSMDKTPLFFTSTGYTKSAITFADENDVLIFIADPLSESLTGVTDESRRTIEFGLS